MEKWCASLPAVCFTLDFRRYELLAHIAAIANAMSGAWYTSQCSALKSILLLYMADFRLIHKQSSSFGLSAASPLRF